MKKLTFILFTFFAFIGPSAVAQSDSTKAANIAIRTNVNRINNALIIIDGNKQYTRGAESLKQINASDIESITILKDAVGIAKYGNDGEEGVILVTTKSGKLSSDSTFKNEIIDFKFKNITEPKHNGILITSKQNNNATPLYVLDGNVIEKSLIDLINPNTIESVTILKDASSTLQYGEAGKNGVIVISTKDYVPKKKIK
jgi:TonB-dependent SusC/RagA subfamily outer membrane receptor